MSDDPFYSLPRAPQSVTSRRQTGRLWLLVLKELREILRDRRTIITLVVMPLLIYPLLALVFQRFLVRALTVNENVEYVVGVESPAAKLTLERQLRVGKSVLEARERAQEKRAPKAAAVDKNAE